MIKSVFIQLILLIPSFSNLKTGKKWSAHFFQIIITACIQTSVTSRSWPMLLWRARVTVTGTPGCGASHASQAASWWGRPGSSVDTGSGAGPCPCVQVRHYIWCGASGQGLSLSQYVYKICLEFLLIQEVIFIVLIVIPADPPSVPY